MKKDTKNTTHRATQRARAHRRDMGVSGLIVWDILRNSKSGFKFRRQYPAGPYFLDFYCREASLALEIDGVLHDAERDEARDRWLAGRGITVIRIPTEEMFEDYGKGLSHWLEELVRTCAERTTPHPQPPLP